MAIDRLGSGIYVSASLRKKRCRLRRESVRVRTPRHGSFSVRNTSYCPFSKKIPASWVGYGQESGPRVVGRLGSGL